MSTKPFRPPSGSQKGRFTVDGGGGVSVPSKPTPMPRSLPSSAGPSPAAASPSKINAYAQNSNNWGFQQQQQPHSGSYGGNDFLSELSSTPTSSFAAFGTSASSFTPTAPSGFAAQYAAARQNQSQSQNGSAQPSQHPTPGSNVTTPLETGPFDFTPLNSQSWPAQPQQQHQQEQLSDQNNSNMGALDQNILASLAEMMGQAQNNANEPQLPLSLLSALSQQAQAQAQQPVDVQQPLAPQMQQQQQPMFPQAQAQDQTPFPGITQQQFVQMLQQVQQQQQIQAAQANFQVAQQSLQEHQQRTALLQQQAAQAQQQVQQMQQAQATASHHPSQEHAQAQSHQTSLLTRRIQQQQSQSQSNTPAHSPRPSFTTPGRSTPSVNGVSAPQPFTQVRPTNNQRVPSWQGGERASETAATTPATSEASMSSPADVSRRNCDSTDALEYHNQGIPSDQAEARAGSGTSACGSA
jgi:hypothetical protein